jgi:hypothetical protein
MSWFRQNSGQKPDYTGLQLQTSVNTLPIPIVWGRTKVAANVIWYANFQTQGSGGGKGGMFRSPTSGYSYSADLIMALCEGPISGIGIIWRDQSTYTLAELGLTFFDGATPQTTWGYLAANYSIEALAYQGTAYACAASYALGDEADIGNHNFEIVGILAGTGVNGIDADPAQVISDFLTNPQYGAGFSPASIDATTLYGAGGDASLQTYCKALGIAFSPALTDQEQGSSILSRWLQLLNCAAVWSGGMLKFIPYGDETIAAGNVTKTIQYPVPTPVQASSGVVTLPSVAVCTAAQFVADGGVTYAFTCAALTYIGAAQPSSAGAYGISPAGTYLFAAGDENQVVAITFTSANATSYVPSLAPVYNLGWVPSARRRERGRQHALAQRLRNHGDLRVGDVVERQPDIGAAPIWIGEAARSARGADPHLRRSTAQCPAGAGVADPIATQLAGGMPLDLGFVNLAPTLSDDFGTVGPSAVLGALDLGTA